MGKVGIRKMIAIIRLFPETKMILLYLTLEARMIVFEKRKFLMNGYVIRE